MQAAVEPAAAAAVPPSSGATSTTSGCPPDPARVQYAVDMRRLFSPPGMIAPNGSINQEFFRPKKVITVNEKRWGDAERDSLYLGLQKHGVGKWREMGQELLQGWDDHTIRIKAARLLGCQNLSWYVGRRFSRQEVEAEYAKNKALGEQTGCWKAGVLVDNDKGVIRAHFLLQQQQQGGTAADAAAGEVEAAS